MRWTHVPLWLWTVSMAGFVFTYLRAGRAWLLWSVVGLRTIVLVLNFVAPLALGLPKAYCSPPRPPRPRRGRVRHAALSSNSAVPTPQPHQARQHEQGDDHDQQQHCRHSAGGERIFVDQPQ